MRSISTHQAKQLVNRPRTRKTFYSSSFRCKQHINICTSCASRKSQTFHRKEEEPKILTGLTGPQNPPGDFLLSWTRDQSCMSSLGERQTPGWERRTGRLCGVAPVLVFGTHDLLRLPMLRLCFLLSFMCLVKSGRSFSRCFKKYQLTFKGLCDHI